jgi:hypothetical protein
MSNYNGPKHFNNITTMAKSFKQNKFGAKPQRQDGVFFASKKELKRWNELKAAEEAGTIRDLRRQVKFPFTIDSKLMFSYYADFVYIEDGSEVVEDSKGFKTPLYKLKKKIIEYKYKIKILET